MLRNVLLAAAALLLAHLYRKLHFKRFKQFVDFPQLPSNLLLGHLKAFGEIVPQGPADRHPDYIFGEMHDRLGRPDIMHVDMRPISHALVLLTTHDLAEQVSRSTKEMQMSVPKASLSHMDPMIGPRSILTAQGNASKDIRKRYNPAFAPAHLMTLLPKMVEMTVRFVENLEKYAETGTEFEMATVTKNLAFDIIGKVTMDVDLEAQSMDPSKQGEIVEKFLELFGLYLDDKADMPWWLMPRVTFKRARLGRQIDVLVKDIISRKHTAQSTSDQTQARSILFLSIPPTEALTPRLIDETCDQIKTFLLAGHDTTATVLSWVFYFLERTPRALAAIRKELDTLLGSETDSEATMKHLASPKGPDVIRNMTYTSAVIKEAMRLEAPSATARYSPPGTGFTVRTQEGRTHCLDGMLIYNVERFIHRDPRVYGDTANHFVPERWLDGQESSEIPASAWRAFERGPRGCIGQELALIEMKLVIAVVARRFDFLKVGLGEIEMNGEGQPVVDQHGVAHVRSELYNTRQINARPVDGMRMKANLR